MSITGNHFLWADRLLVTGALIFNGSLMLWVNTKENMFMYQILGVI